MRPNEKPRDDDDLVITDELLIDYALGEIDPEDRTRIELKLAEDPELMREAKALKRMASHMGVSMIMPPPRLVSRTRRAAYEARAKRGGWRRLVTTVFRKPVTAAAAGLVAVALVVALIGPWRGTTTSPGDQTTSPTGSGLEGRLPEGFNPFLKSNLGYFRALSRGEVPDVGDMSVQAGQAMTLAKTPGLPRPQVALLEDIKAVWEYGYNRVNSAGVLSDDILVELRDLAASKRLVERIQALLDATAEGS